MIVHKPVLLEEVLRELRPQANQDFIDATVGQGGHAEALLRRTLPEGRLLGFDRDPKNLAVAKKRLQPFGRRVKLVNDNYSTVLKHAYDHGFNAVSGILLDLGFSSAHVDDPKRGFSFQLVGPLDMRYDLRQELSAATIVNEWSEDQLALIFRKFGEEQYARQIAQAIVKTRRTENFQTTSELAELVMKVKPRFRKIHPATQVFQALRIAVNDELASLEQVLPDLLTLLAPGGRLAVISFQSLEDRIVKRFFIAKQTEIKIINKKPVIASSSEIKENPRARSAKLRVCEKR